MNLSRDPNSSFYDGRSSTGSASLRGILIPKLSFPQVVASEIEASEPAPKPIQISRLAFVSHHHLDLPIAQAVVSDLSTLGFAGFIAHRDLTEGSNWVEEIKRNLREAAVLIAILTLNFVRSDWADHEVGFGVGRDVPILPIDAGATPYGFMRDVQALRWGDEATEAARPGQGRMLWSRDQLVDRIVRFGNALKLLGVLGERDLVPALVRSTSWNGTMALLQLIGSVESLSDSEGIAIAEATTRNSDISECYAARKVLPPLFQRIRGQLDREVRKALVERGLLDDSGKARTPSTLPSTRRPSSTR